MGLLRIYLALCVVASHSGRILPWPVHDSHEAVQIFFLISGFYMALIQSKYPSVTEFWVSRALRIFVPYWAILLGVTGASVLLGLTSGYWGALEAWATWTPERNGVAGLVVAAVTTVILFGQDVVMYLSDDPGQGLAFTSDFTTSPHPLFRYLLIPPAWSVAIELAFYVLVPFLARLRTPWLVALTAASLAARVAVWEVYDLARDPWFYRFFPFELAMFTSGMLSCRLYLAHRPRFAALARPLVPRTTIAVGGWIGGLAMLFLATKLVEFGLRLTIGKAYAPLLSYTLWFALLPIAFDASKSLGWDRVIGELSYPVYLVHYFLARALRALVVGPGLLLPDAAWGPLTAVLSIALSYALVRLVVNPLDERRYAMARRVAGRVGADVTPAPPGTAGP